MGTRTPAFRGIPKENGVSISRLKFYITFQAKAAIVGISRAPAFGVFPRRTASPYHASSPASPFWQRRPRGHQSPAFRGIPKENGVSISRLKPCVAFLAKTTTWVSEPRRSGAFPRRTASPSHASSPASPSWTPQPPRSGPFPGPNRRRQLSFFPFAQFCAYFNQHCFIGHPSNSTVSEGCWD